MIEERTCLQSHADGVLYVHGGLHVGVRARQHLRECTCDVLRRLQQRPLGSVRSLN